ncbi:hypothetical protein K504DRAFT_432796 [Pleomassaria siparia CBS 279.74]|uniref:F-box domain-containing protein n=1 Tax=Pleomassaria siparia CBS 279.74 TaxID=1314801 RepID=A0A6G1KBB5_9PLEO|nr:hypothetical protein K504DRAFT_432796 [Pleomassaria siparia CBS 279.74]
MSDYTLSPRHANHLPDELLLQILDFIPKSPANQSTVATFALVSRQWYNVSIPRLYKAPFLYGGSYELFIRTVCPSVLAHIKRSELAGHVKVLDLSHIVHQGNKSTTARLLGRTKTSLEVFIAPQASFAINCWAALSKCSKLLRLDLSLVSECISYQSLNQTVKQLSSLTALMMPRCSAYEGTLALNNIQWPPRLRHLQLSGSIHGKLIWDFLRQPDTFPPTMSSLNISHCPGLDHREIRSLLKVLAGSITNVELHNLPAVKQGRLNAILEWLPNLKSLTMSIEYISTGFATPSTPSDASFPTAPTFPSPQIKPLESFTLVTSGMQSVDINRAFTAVDLFALVDERVLGRIRTINIAASTGWMANESAELEALEMVLVNEVDKESWEARRWHYADLKGIESGITYLDWVATPMGARMRARVNVIRNR